MNPFPRISEAEWEVLSLLWREAPLSSAQIITKLESRSWKPSTVRTFLARLEKKGAVGTVESAEGRLYKPKVSRDVCVRQESLSFLDRVFEGATASLLIHFAGSRRLSDREISELEAVLAKNRRRNKS